MFNATRNVTNVPQDTSLSSKEKNLNFTYQIGKPHRLFLSPNVFVHAGITLAPNISISIHKTFHENCVLQQDSPVVYRERITKTSTHQVSGIMRHSQKKLITFLFFWEKEGHRWKKLSEEPGELNAAITEQKEIKSDIGTHEKQLAEVERGMKLRPSLRPQRAQESEGSPNHVQKQDGLNISKESY